MGKSQRLRDQAARCTRLSLEGFDIKTKDALRVLARESNDAAACMEAAELALLPKP